MHDCDSRGKADTTRWRGKGLRLSMVTRCSARARATKIIGQLSALRWVRAMGMAWAGHSARSAVKSHEVARLFTGFSIRRCLLGRETSHRAETYLFSFRMWYAELSEGSLAISAKENSALMFPPLIKRIDFALSGSTPRLILIRSNR